MREYVIFTDVTADLSPELIAGLPEIRIIPMEVTLGNKTYTYGPGGTITAKEFYEGQRSGLFASTSQINPSAYLEHFEPCLRSGKDILYFSFSSGLSSTYQSAQICIRELKEQYPERKLLCVDTLGASLGEGFLVLEAAKRQAAGMSLEELAAWAEKYREKVCHWFTVDTFVHLKHGGRVSSASAAMGTMLQIKPLLHVDHNGKLEAMEKPRGRNRAVAAQVEKMTSGWLPELGKQVLIGHGDDMEAAVMLKGRLMERFPDAEIRIADIGPVIGAHTGPGVLALFYWGDNR